MRGLILKDIMNLKKPVKIYIIVIAFYMAISFSSGDSSFMQFMICLFAAMLPITALAYDERAEWDKYALSMPVSRKEVVLSKYCLGLICMAIGILIVLVFTMVVPKSLVEGQNFIWYGGFLGVGFLSIVLPIIFKFGVEKGRILMLIVIFIPSALVMLIERLDVPIPSKATLNMVKNMLPIIIVAMLILSVAISLQIYKKKEL